ncbi:Uncharacterised protein [Mycobacterium tuberculosis]|nr:Uncharacterised protein [Mycobacterium tuberculosis]
MENPVLICIGPIKVVGMGEGLRATCWIWGIDMDETGQASVMVWLKFCAGHRVMGLILMGPIEILGMPTPSEIAGTLMGGTTKGPR